MDTIAPDPANARVHPQLAFGQQKPVLVDGRGVIVAGASAERGMRRAE
jgi:hypothetical protein